MTLYLHSTLAFLLLSWLVYALHRDSSQVAYLLKQTTVWIVSMLLLAALLSTLVKKPALALEQDPYGPWARLLEREMLTTQELSPSIKCFNPLRDHVLKVACETEPLHCIILYGITKSRICSCLKTIKEQKTTESATWTTEFSSQNCSMND